MWRLLPWLVSTLLAATPAGAQDSRVHLCSVDRSAALGRVRAAQIFSATGESGARVVRWEAELAPNLTIEAQWHDRAPATDPNQGWVMIRFVPPRRAAHRMEIRREDDGPVNELRLGGIAERPFFESIEWFTNWSTLGGVAQGAPRFQVVILDGRGSIVRRAPIDPAALAEVLALAVAAQAEMDRLIADYRSCDPLPVE